MTNAVRDLGPPAQGTVPLSAPRFRGSEWKYLKECLDSGWISSAGGFVTRFEKEMAEYLGVGHAVATVNGTAALHLALETAGVKAGDEVLVPSMTFIATVNAVAYTGAHPRFVDCERTTYGMDPDILEEWLTRETVMRDGACYDRTSGRRVSACLPVHVFGHPARIDAIVDACARRGIPVIEDAAESLGSTYRGRHTGTFGRAGCLSFNGNKILTTGGGGMVVTDDSALAARARHLSTQAKANGMAYWHDAVGYNYRMPGLNAAIGCAQLESLPDELDGRRKLSSSYQAAFDDARRVTLLKEPADAQSNYWLQAIQVESAERRDAILAALDRAGFQARPVWAPAHRQPMFGPLHTGDLTVTDALWHTTVNLPSSGDVTPAQVETIATIVKDLS